MKTWRTKDWDSYVGGHCIPADEPDKAQWIDPETNLDCLIVRGPVGALCGYVGVPTSHAFHSKEYDEVNADVHWGLTFSDSCQQTDNEAEHICHTGDVANENVWWFGFDCSHSGDFCPSYQYEESPTFATYKTFDYVKKHVTSLASQLAELDKEQGQ